MAAVSRRTQMNETPRDQSPNSQNNPHELEDLEAVLLQTFIARRVLGLDDALNVLGNVADITESDVQVDQDSFEEIISRINMVIADLDLEIRQTLDQSTGNPIWALVNTTSDAFSQLATTHSVNEISYMRGLLDAIFETSNSLHEEVFAVRSNEASNLCAKHGITKTVGEAAIQAFIREGWLEKSLNGFITLSERGLLELKGYVMEEYNDVDDGEEEEGGRVDKMRTCHACQEIITKGQRCGTLRCLVRFHNHCAANFFTPRNNSCPSCKTAWKEHLPVGEAACSDRSRRRVSNRQQDSGSESPEPRRNSTHASPTSRRSSAASERSRSPPARRNGTASRGSRRGSSRRTSAAQSIQEEEEEDDEED